MAGVLAKTAEVLSDCGFVPTGEIAEASSLGGNPRRKPETHPITLFEAVRLASGVDWADMDSSDVTFWNWLELRRSWSDLWTMLDNAISLREERKVRVIPWAYQRVRTLDEVLEFLGFAIQNFGDPVVPTPNRRPDAKFMVASGRLDAAIANTIAVVRSNQQIDYWTLLCAIDKPGIDDEELLKHLDSSTTQVGFDRSLQDSQDLVPRQLVRARQEISSRIDSIRRFSDFLHYLTSGNDRGQLSDLEVLKKLLVIAPEQSEIVRKLLMADDQER